MEYPYVIAVAVASLVLGYVLRGWWTSRADPDLAADFQSSYRSCWHNPNPDKWVMNVLDPLALAQA